MSRRLYFMLPDVQSAHAMRDEILLERFNAKHIHFLARPGTDLGDLPQASLSERTDLIGGWEIGMGLGALLGLIAGVLAVAIPPWPFSDPVPLVAIPICTLVGLVAGGLWTALVASSIPNVRLKPFEREIAQGKVLMMVLVPFHRALEIRDLVVRKHPEAVNDEAWPIDHIIFH